MQKNNFISIIIPVYNAEKYIERCVESVLNQTYQNFELILINDGSKDLSWQKLQKYKNNQKAILINQSNIGAGATRNKGISLASGTYIMFIDNDDYIEKDYLENYINNANGFDVVLGGYKRKSINGKILYKKDLKNTLWSKYEIMAPWARIIKKEVLIANKIKFYEFRIGEDIVFNLNLYASTDKIKIISYNGYDWINNENSVSNTSQKKIDVNILILLDEIKKYCKDTMSNYYILRYSIWYLLFSGKNSISKDFLVEYKKVFKWLKFNNIITNNPFVPFMYENELKNMLILSVFLIISKLNLINLFSKIYCKNDWM